MADETTYTDNFLFPLLSDGSENWGAVINGMLETIDIELKAAQSPITDRSADVIVDRITGDVVLQHYQF